MHVLSVREAMGGRWAGNVEGWLIILLPTMLLVVLQETTTGASGVPLALALGLMEHVVAGAVVFLVIWPARRHWTIIPLWFMIGLWVLIGVARGVVWSAWHVWVLHDSADLGYRILVWVAISLVWSPLYTYSLAQLDRRRSLLGELTAVRNARATERARADQSARQRTRTLVSTVQSTIGPVIAQLHHSLSAITPRLTEDSVEAMAEKLSVVAFDTSRLVAPDVPQVPEVAPAVHRAPVSAALDFPPDRPMLAAALAGIVILPLIVPDTLRVQGVGFALITLLAISVVVVLLAACLAILRWTRLRFGRPRVVALIFAFLIPGAIGSLLIAAIPGPPLSVTLPLLILLPVAAAFAGSNVGVAVGLAYSNRDLAARVAAIHAETQQLIELADEADRRSREQLAELLHGPVYGRLSACVMALNFHAEELAAGDTSRSDSIVSTVLEYLEAASRDLDALVSP